MLNVTVKVPHENAQNIVFFKPGHDSGNHQETTTKEKQKNNLTTQISSHIQDVTNVAKFIY